MKNFWREQIDYLKDNPKEYWFKSRLYGWGWTPATREGWFIMLVFIIALITTVIMFDPETKTDDEVLTILLPRVGGIIGLFIVIAYMKGERPRWMWGERRSKPSRKRLPTILNKNSDNLNSSRRERKDVSHTKHYDKENL